MPIKYYNRTMQIHPIEGYIQTTYLVEYDDKLLLFDSACRCDVTLVVEKMESLGRKLSDLNLIAISHMHPDHSGGAKYLKELTGAKIIGPREANSMYKGLMGTITWLVDIYLTIFVARKKEKKIRNVFFPRKLNFDFFFEDHSKLPGFDDWIAFKANGHTFCDFNFYNTDTKSLYVADNIIQLKNKIIAPYPRLDPASYKKSLEKYLSFEVELFLLAHHGPQRFTHSQIQELIDRTPDQQRSHRNSAKRIVSSLSESFFRKNNVQN